VGNKKTAQFVCIIVAEPRQIWINGWYHWKARYQIYLQ